MSTVVISEPTNLRGLAEELANHLKANHRVRKLHGPVLLRSDWTSWEIRFDYQGLSRHFLYEIQRIDGMDLIRRALFAGTNGELMVRVPDETNSTVLTNKIYYPSHG